MFRFSHVIEQKFQDDGAAEAATFDFKVAEPLRSEITGSYRQLSRAVCKG